MYNALLINVLKSFTEDEIKDFEKFVNSPFFVNREKVSELFDILKSAYPEFPHEAIVKENIYEKLYPETEYNDILMRKLISELYGASKEYLTYTGFKRDTFACGKYLIEEGNSRGLTKLTQTGINQMEKLLLEKPERNEKYYYFKYRLEDQRRILDSNANVPRNWQPTFDNYCNYFLVDLLRHYIVMFNDMKFFKVDYKLHFADEILDMLHGGKFLKVPAIAIYYYSIKSYLDFGNEDYFYKLKELLFKYGKELGKVSEGGLYVYLQNYCNRRADTGELKFLQERFYIMEKMVRKRLCIVNGFIEKGPFSSMVIMALELGKISYAENFIKKHRSSLNPAQSSNVLNFNYACLELYKKNYESSLEYLSKVEYTNFYDKIIVRSLNLMIYYEAGIIEQGMSLVDSFKHFLSTNKGISPNLKDRAKNFIDIVNQLFKIKEGSSKIDIIKLKEHITRSNTILGRMWLTGKVNEL